MYEWNEVRKKKNKANYEYIQREKLKINKRKLLNNVGLIICTHSARTLAVLGQYFFTTHGPMHTYKTLPPYIRILKWMKKKYANNYT